MQSKVCLVILIVTSLDGLSFCGPQLVHAEGESTIRTLQVRSWHCWPGTDYRRKDSSYIIGDMAYIKDYVTGISTGPNGKPNIMLTTEFLDDKRNVLPNQSYSWTFTDSNLPLGADSCISILLAETLGLSGLAMRRVIVQDLVSGQRATFDLPFSRLPPLTFGLFDVSLANTPQGFGRGAVFSLGQPVFLKHKISGLTKKEDHTQVKESVKVIDRSNGKIIKDFGSEVITRRLGEYEADGSISVFAAIYPTTRHGEFLFQINLEDLNSRKKATHEIPFRVVASPDLDDEQTKPKFLKYEIRDNKTKKIAKERISVNRLKLKSWLSHPGFGFRKIDPSFTAEDWILIKDHITGLSTNEKGDSKFTTLVEFFDDDGRPIPGLAKLQALNEHPVDEGGYISKQTTRIVDFSGPVKRRFTITDHLSGQQIISELSFTLLGPSAFAVFDASLSRVQTTQIPESLFTPGHNIVVRFRISGASAKKHRFLVKGRSKIIDRKSRKTIVEFDSASATGVIPMYGNSKFSPLFTYTFTPNRPGECLFQINVEDLNNGKKLTHEIPFDVISTPDLDELEEAEKNGKRTGTGPNGTVVL